MKLGRETRQKVRIVNQGHCNIKSQSTPSRHSTHVFAIKLHSTELSYPIEKGSQPRCSARTRLSQVERHAVTCVLYRYYSLPPRE